MTVEQVIEAYGEPDSLLHVSLDPAVQHLSEGKKKEILSSGLFYGQKRVMVNMNGRVYRVDDMR